jgi:Fur family ferric uptake transcriptional regulator/Fur family zinc uptake transcriptional regulator
LTAKAHGERPGLRALLKLAGLKVTPVRMEILDYLVKAGHPLSHAEIHSALPDMDRVTIYRTLTSFTEADIAHQIQGLDGTWRFCAHERDSEGCPGNHPHFLCESCGRMFCLLDQHMPRVDVREDDIVKSKQFVLYGLCAECAVKPKRGKARERTL